MLSHTLNIFLLYSLVLISANSLASNTESIVCPWTNYCGPDSSNTTGLDSKCQCGADRICGAAPWFNCLTCTQCPSCDGCAPPPTPTPPPPPTPPPVETSTASAEPSASTAVEMPDEDQPPYNVNENGCGCMHKNACGPDTCGITGPLSACQCSSGQTCAGYPEFTCLAPGVSKPYTGVDFIIWAQAAVDSLSFETATFDPSGCAYQEKIITELGQRKLMRFSTQIHNIGTENFMLGSPTDPQNQELFVWSPCHGHYHLYGWSLYQLFDSSGKEVAVGHKQGFCLRDTVRVNNKGPTSGVTTCYNQGITANWGDLYSAQTDGQWIDITGMPSGKYKLRITVNPNRVFRETNYANNAVEISVTIP